MRFSNAPWPIGGSYLWVSLLFLGFLFFLFLGFKTGKTELYVLTVTKEESPIFYWPTMGMMTVGATFFGFYLFKNLFKTLAQVEFGRVWKKTPSLPNSLIVFSLSTCFQRISTGHSGSAFKNAFP